MVLGDGGGWCCGGDGNGVVEVVVMVLWRWW